MGQEFGGATHHRHLSAQQCSQGFVGPLVGHGGELHAGLLRQLLHRQVRCRVDAGMAVAQIAGVLARIGQQLGQRAIRCIGRYCQAEHEATQPRHVGNVAQRVERRLLHQRQTEHGQGQQGHRVAVGLGAGQHHGAQAAAGPGLVLHRHRHAQAARHRLGHRTAHRIGGPTRHRRRNQRDGPGRKGLGKHRRQVGARSECDSEAAAINHDGVTSVTSVSSVSRCCAAPSLARPGPAPPPWPRPSRPASTAPARQRCWARPGGGRRRWRCFGR